MKMNINFGRAVIGGLIGTAVMTMVGLFAAPMMGLPPMNPAEMLAGPMGGSMILGWGAHLMIGVILALGYALVNSALPGPGAARGAIYSLAPFFMAQLLVMPMMGMPLFSGSATMAMGSLVGHIVYGAVVGGIYGEAHAVQVAAA
jgi:uncharacterized membrane protein YagU involved in acid resistance